MPRARTTTAPFIELSKSLAPYAAPNPFESLICPAPIARIDCTEKRPQVSNDLSSQDQERALERRILRGVLKAVWALISSIGLVILGPWLLLIVVGLFGGTFDIGTPELILVWLCWLIGIPTVAVLWYRKYVASS